MLCGDILESSHSILCLSVYVIMLVACADEYQLPLLWSCVSAAYFCPHASALHDKDNGALENKGK